MDKNKANKILKALSDLYNTNNITEDFFYTLDDDDKLLATMWCLIDTNLALDPINPRRTIIQSLSSVTQQNFRDINTDLVNKLNSKDYSTSLDTLIKLLDDLSTNYTNYLQIIIDRLNNNDTNSVNDNILNQIKLVVDNYSNVLTNIDTTLTKLNSNKVEIINVTPVIIEEGIITNIGSTESRDVSKYSVITYQVITTAILGIASLSLQGSLDNINWCNLPITYCSSINVINNIVNVNSKGSTTLSVNAITKYVRLNIVGNNTKNTINLYLK